MKIKAYSLLLLFAVVVDAFAADKPKPAQPSPQFVEEQMVGMLRIFANSKDQPHREFQKEVGEWATSEKHFGAPQQPPPGAKETKPEQPVVTTGKGTAKIRLILDGRYLIQEYKSTNALGGEFTAMSITGFDNAQGQYEMLWIDSASTAMPINKGKKNGDTITLDRTEKMFDGTLVDYRMTVKEIDADTRLVTMFSRVSGKKEFLKNMEITHTRAKK